MDHADLFAHLRRDAPRTFAFLGVDDPFSSPHSDEGDATQERNCAPTPSSRRCFSAPVRLSCSDGRAVCACRLRRGVERVRSKSSTTLQIERPPRVTRLHLRYAQVATPTPRRRRGNTLHVERRASSELAPRRSIADSSAARCASRRCASTSWAGPHPPTPQLHTQRAALRTPATPAAGQSRPRRLARSMRATLRYPIAPSRARASLPRLRSA